MPVLETMQIIALDSPSWMQRAQCTAADPELFFPANRKETAQSTRNPATRQALDICRVCGVRNECLRWAFERGDDDAVLGGTTPGDRRKTGRRISWAK